LTKLRWVWTWHLDFLPETITVASDSVSVNPGDFHTIPGCTVAYDRCKLHHIIWWTNGGHTDLDNLIPVCSHHHTKIHHDGWIIGLGPHRELTLTLPDSTTHTTGPPQRRQPAA
jgi:hypothetical protein